MGEARACSLISQDMNSVLLNLPGAPKDAHPKVFSLVSSIPLEAARSNREEILNARNEGVFSLDVEST